MTHEIIEMAREAGFKMENSAAIQAAETFAKLVAVKEREACAKICDSRAIEYDGFTEEQNASEKLAAAIRARGEA
jgi:hypothetical protein